MNRNRLGAALVAATALALPASAQAADYDEAVRDSNPLTYLRLDEPLGTLSANDEVSSNPDAAYLGGVTLGVDGPFDDANTAATLATSSTVPPVASGTVVGDVAAASHTLELWVKPNRVPRGSEAGIVAHGIPSAGGWSLGIGARRKLAIVTGSSRVQTKITLASNVWTQLHVTWSLVDNTVRVYVNGALKKAFTSGMPTAGGAFVLGGNGAGVFTGNFSGTLDEAALYSAELTGLEVRDHFLAAHVPSNTTPPRITGLLAVGQTLTARPGVWTDSASATRVYQWQRCDALGDDCGDIIGATATTYVLAAEDESMTLQVAETVTNQSGASTAISDLTGKVGPRPTVNPTPDPGTGTGTAPAPLPQPAANPSVTACLRVTAGRKRVKLRPGYGTLRRRFSRTACLTKPILALVKPRTGTRLKTVRYKLDGRRLKRLKNVKFAAKLRPSKLGAGRHMLKMRVTKRTGNTKIFKVRLRTAVT
jgi:hypothetical protein